MHEYTVIFTAQYGKFGILIKEAKSEEDAIINAIREARIQGRAFFAVEAVLNV